MTDVPPKFPVQIVPENAGHIPEEPRLLTQWVCWRLEVRNGKPTKVPYQPNGRPADSTDPGTWSSFNDVLAAYEAGGFDGVGFVFSKSSSYCGVDLDGCRDAVTGQVAPWAKEIIEALDSYSEVSPSGTGMKVFLKARKPGPKCKKAYMGGHV